MDRPEEHVIYEFGGYRLDPTRRTLSRIGAGVVRLKPRVFDTLLYFVEHPSELLDKGTMMQAIWPNIVVEENSLSQSISVLRRSLGETPAEHRFIVTEPGRGYRFVAEVKTLHAPPVERLTPGMPGPESTLASVTVLPFKNLTPSAPHSFLAEAIPIELHHSLSRIHQLRVVSGRSAFARADAGKDPKTIARDLRVQYVIWGSVAEIGDEIRLIAELYDASEDVLLWSECYGANTNNVLMVQQDIAESVAGAFGGERLRAEIERASTVTSTDLAAWDLVQRARAYLLDYRVDNIARAVSLLEKAVELDPDYATAHATLGLVTAEKTLNAISGEPAADRASALEAVSRAEALAPQDPEVLSRAGAVNAYCGEYEASIELLRRAVARAPYDLGAWGYFGWPLVATGNRDHLAELHRILDRLLRAGPKHPGRAYWLFHKSVAHTCEDDCERALEYARQSIAEQPRFAVARMHCANVLGRLAQSEAAHAAVDRCTAVNPGMSPAYYLELMRALSDQESVVDRRSSGLYAAKLLNRK